MTRVRVKPELVQWALDRAELTADMLSAKFPKLEQWERGESLPTLRQLESFARATYTPIGLLFLTEPPTERLSLPDFRSGRDLQTRRISPNLLDTVYACQQRQEWYREYALSVGEQPLPFVGTAGLTDDVETVARNMRLSLQFDLDERHRMGLWTDALRRFIEQADDLGILVMCSGVVQNNTRRHLNPNEFRGFALVDPLAPVVFVNGADTKAAQMFTLAHELAHIWLGESALSDTEAADLPELEVERWCNQVAAEFLVPMARIIELYDPDHELATETQRLARAFKVSTLVILRRIHDVGGLTRTELWEAFEAEKRRLIEIPRPPGGNFYLTQAARVSKRFARAIVVSTLEGQTLYTEAFRLLGVRKADTFEHLGRTLGIGN